MLDARRRKRLPEEKAVAGEARGLEELSGACTLVSAASV